MNTTSAILTSILIFAFGLGEALQPAQHQAPPSPTPTHQGAGRYVQVEYPPSTAANELQVGVTYNLWIPGGAPRLRCVIVHQHGAGAQASKGGETAAYDLHWQALAKKWDCALLGPFYHVLGEKTDTSPGGSELWMDPRLGSDKSFLEALEEMSVQSGHPELNTVPWVLWGHSGGAIWSNVMTMLHPERVVAVFLRSASAASFRFDWHVKRPEFRQPEVPAAVYTVPIMCNAGVKEKPENGPLWRWNGVWEGELATFQEYRTKGAPIGFAPDPRTAHDCGDSRYLAIPFLDACIAMRLPAEGSKDQTLRPVDSSQVWLASLLGDTAVPAADFKGNPREAVWLPNAAVAHAWMEYVKNGTVGDSSPPSAPFDLKVVAKPEQGNEITWDAEADFESGIGGFIILRDGRGLARLPTAPQDRVYGGPRPLFQGISFHDTPEAPIPEMRYLDTSSHAGEKHTYTVITLNSAGVPSEPSAPATVP
jgi:pimeloyl-ACP methyl ester carboxylesterase